MLALVAWAAAPPPFLPDFAGWHKSKSEVAQAAPWPLPAPEAQAMTEYGLRSLERDTYQRSGRSITVEGLRFDDVYGSYGAFTYYRPDNFHPFDLAQPKEQAASGDNVILFTRGVWLVRVHMDELTAMTASEMRQLAAALTASAGGGPLPSSPYYLPPAHLLAGDTHFVEGPTAFSAFCHWLAPEAVGFNMGAQAELGDYDLGAATPAQMAVIAYPTPQIARSHFGALQKMAGFSVRRSGPILVLLHGASGADADQLLQAVNYDADITMVPPTPVGIDALPALILGIFVLCGFIIGVAVVVGLLTGGTRAMLERWFPERFEKAQREALIRLNLK